MPSAGDVTVQFKAETRQFRRELKLTGEAWGKLGTEARLAETATRGAGKNAFARIASDVRRAKTDFRSGIISTRDYGTALRFAQQEASALVRQGTRPAGKALSSFNLIMGQTVPKTQAARQGIGAIRSTVASLGARMVGVNGTVGTLISGIGQFALGNLAAIGVIGGLAALAAGFKRVKEQAGEAAKAIGTDLDELLKRIGGPELTESQQAIKNLGDAQARMRDVMQEISRSAATFRRNQLASGGGDVLAAGGTLPAFQLSDTQRENLKKATAAVEAAERATIRMTAQERLDGFDAMREAHEKAAEAARDLDDRWNSIVQSMQKLKQKFTESSLGAILTVSTAGGRGMATSFEQNRPSLFGGTRRPSTLETMERLGGTGLRLPEVDNAALSRNVSEHRYRLRRQLMDVEEEMRKRRTAFQEIGEQLGESMIRGLVRSFLEGGENLGDRLKTLLKSVITDAVSEGLIAALRQARGGEGGGSFFGGLFKSLFQVGVTAGATATGGPGAGAAAGAAVANAPRGMGPTIPGLSGNLSGGGINLDIAMTKPSNPVAMARDADWLGALSESLLNLEAGGFRSR